MKSRLVGADDALLLSVQDALRRSGARHGSEVTLGGLHDPVRADALHVNVLMFDQGDTRFVSISRHPVHDEGSEGISYTFVAPAGTLHAREASRLDAFVAEGARLRRREAAIVRETHSGVAPSWCYVMHRVARLILSHSAGARDLVLFPVPENLVKPHRSRSRRTSLSTGRAMGIYQTNFVGRYGRNVVEARADRVFVHDLEIGVRPDNSPLAVFHDQAAPELMVTGMQLPQTALLSCVGEDLARIVDHPAFGEHAGIPVLRAVNDESNGSVRLHLPLVLEPAGPAPAGADTTWRRT
jgi:hypothetical protein